MVTSGIKHSHNTGLRGRNQPVQHQRSLTAVTLLEAEDPISLSRTRSTLHLPLTQTRRASEASSVSQQLPFPTLQR